MIKSFALALIIMQSAMAAQTINMVATENGFEPLKAKVKPNEEVILSITRKTDSTCAREISIPSKKIKKELPLNKTVTVNLGKLSKGDIKFSCGMDMYQGVITAQ